MPVVGGFEGLREYQNHQMGQIMSALSAADKLSELDLAPARTRLFNAQADAAELEAQQNSQFMQALSQEGAVPVAGQPTVDGQPAGRAASLYKMADIAFRAGALKKAQDFLSKASTIEHQENEDIATKNKIRFYQNKDAMDDLERLGGFFDGVQSQADLDEAVRQYQATYPGRPLPAIAQQPYSPYLIKRFQQSLKTERERVMEREKDEDQELRRKEQAARAEAEERRRVAAEEIAQFRREREERLSKAGGGKVSTSVGKDLPMLTAREITESIFDGVVPPEFKGEVEGARMVIAARAKQLLEQNRGLSMDQAVTLAVQESREANEWEGATASRPKTFAGFQTGWSEDIKGFRFKSRSTVSGVGSQDWAKRLSPEKKQAIAAAWAAAKPATKDTKFVEGQVYKTPRGNLMYSGGKLYTQQEWAERE